MTKATCTVRSAVSGVCGEDAVYTETSRLTDELFGECETHAAQAGSLFNTRHLVSAAGRLSPGDTVKVERHGKVYTGTVARVTRSGTVYATVTYDNGTTKTVKV